MIALFGCNQHSSGHLYKAKSIDNSIANNERVDSDVLNNLNELSNNSIDYIRNINEESFIISPLSYYLSIATMYSLSSSELSGDLLDLFSAKDKNDLSKQISSLIKRISLSKENGLTDPVVKIANLIIDDSSALDDNIEFICDNLYSSYIKGNATKKDMDKWIDYLSEGSLKTYDGVLPESEFLSFINGIYFDMNYELMFETARDLYQPFNGNGNYRFMNGDTYFKYAYKGDEYDAFALRFTNEDYCIRFVQPHDEPLKSFFKNHSFVSCFELKQESDMQKHMLKMPYLTFKSELDLLNLAIEQGFFNDNEIKYNDKLINYSPNSIVQQNDVVFDNNGVKAVSVNLTNLIPEEMPILSFSLDTSFAFEILGRDNIVLFHGEVNSID